MPTGRSDEERKALSLYRQRIKQMEEATEFCPIERLSPEYQAQQTAYWVETLSKKKQSAWKRMVEINKMEKITPELQVEFERLSSSIWEVEPQLEKEQEQDYPPVWPFLLAGALAFLVISLQ